MRILLLHILTYITNLWGKMNRMRGKSIGLILGLALLIWVSCEDPGIIGIDVDPDNLSFSAHYQQFTLPAKLVQVDSIVSGNAGRVLVGRYNDPLFGTTTAKAYSQVWLSTSINIPENGIFDSLILQLKLDHVNGLEEEFSELHNLKLYRLTEDIDEFTTFYTTSESIRSRIQFGSAIFTYDTIQAGGEIKVNLDTTLRITMQEQLGQLIFDKMKDEFDSTFDSNTNWLAFFQGIVLEPGDEYFTITGFKIKDSRSNMIMYYHYTDDEGEIVNAEYNFNLEPAVHYSNISHDPTGTAIGGTRPLYTEYTASDNNIYLQAGTGIVAKIDFTPVIEFADTIDLMILNTAILTLGSVDEYPPFVKPPDKLIFYYTDSSNFRLKNQEGFLKTIQQDNPSIDATSARFPLESAFVVNDSTKNIIESYSDRITSYVQALIDGVIEDHLVLAYPVTLTNATTIDRLLLDPESIKLEIYYTTSKESADSE